MSSNKTSQDAENAPIEIVTYDPAWPSRFEEERVVLEDLLAPWIVADIEHVGSTAVPGLAAKPVIDIMVPVESLAGSRGSIETASHAGYMYWPYKADVMHWFVSLRRHIAPTIFTSSRSKALYGLTVCASEMLCEAIPSLPNDMLN